MRNTIVKIAVACSLMAFLSLWMACKTNELMVEPAKSIQGTWKIAKVLRNGEDLTDRVDITHFQLTFQRDPAGSGEGLGHYKIVNGAPFMVRDDGTWKLNDPAYPFYLILTPESVSKPVQIKFYYPDVAGQNQISLTFSPGCTSNTYEYLLKKVSK